MKIADIKKGDTLVNVDIRGAGWYRVVKVNRQTIDVITEQGRKVRCYPIIFDRKIVDPEIVEKMDKIAAARMAIA